MSKRQIITYSTQAGDRGPSHAYYLATTHDVVGFYCFDEPSEEGGTPYVVIDRLDRGRLLGAGNKETAKLWASRLGLSNYIYVRV
ncbi:hypothetical protein ACQKIE_01210 [Luteibacter sp. NPDC031894]|uniref:hypothetical protein n=1 Tax=Luteibacter sp. NPDC031894 TaxID=3390572 RepID=UPI003D063C24